MNKEKMMNNIIELAKSDYCKELNELSPAELHYVVGKAVMGEISDKWNASKKNHASKRRAYYLSAEFLMGRMMYNNLFNLGILNEVKDMLAEQGIDINVFEEVDDTALGNGGLGRLAACFLDSAATHDIPLDGYGIRYKYGLFKQLFENGHQVEVADDWQKFNDPWCIRREEDAVLVHFRTQTVRAVPYDMAVIGYGTDNINTLRLWQAEPVENFNFVAFNNSDYTGAVADKNAAEDISKVLYPNDNQYQGKVLRLKQQYFFSSASMQDILKRYKAKYGNDFSHFADEYAIQLNDTHPVVAIPELMRLLCKEGVDEKTAFAIAQKTFNYTNHTVLGEALEKWNVGLMKDVIPEIFEYIEKIQWHMGEDFHDMKLDWNIRQRMNIIDHEQQLIHMAKLAIYVSSHTNGVAALHTEILKNDVLKDWYKLYPERFQNKTNGITQRRWLGLCNPELSQFITDRVGEGWMKNLDKLSQLNNMIDENAVNEFNAIKRTKKQQLSDFILKQEGVYVNPDFIFDVQVKRLHEYKRQLMNAFSIVAIYQKLKAGELPDWNPTAFIFGAKAAPGYARAKAIIKYINEIAKLVNNDPDTKDKLQVVFVTNFNVSYGEKIYPAADISEQISTAGLEASGTGNMKFMLNGAVTLGTYDGANVEITEKAGEENEYIFGARVEEIDELKAKHKYHSRNLYNANATIKAAVDTLIDGTFSDDIGTDEIGTFRELYNSLLNGAHWHKADNYFIMLDLQSYIDKKIEVNSSYADRIKFGTQCLKNVANAGFFSSDRTILDYAANIWGLTEQ